MPAGRPSKYNPKFHPNNYLEQSRQGKTIAQIAADWDIARDTLWKWSKAHPEFADAFQKGREFAEAWYMDLGRQAMLGGKAEVDGKIVNVHLGFYVWMTKNMFKWQDNVYVEAKPAPERPLKELTDEQLTQLAKKELK